MKFRQYLIISILALGACQGVQKETGSEETSSVVASNIINSSNSSIQRLVNPNLATKEELQDMEVLSEEMVKTILENRPYLSMTAFNNEMGSRLDSTAKAQLYSRLFVPFNLNSTPKDEFKLIPGVGNRMAHEFEEYRPYIKIDQFRREIGKYVDEDEVSRLEQYVFVPVELNTATEEDILLLPGVGKRMAHEFEEYRPYNNLEQFRREIGKYVDDKELSRLERLVYLAD